jgi:hypothetical protein
VLREILMREENLEVISGAGAQTRTEDLLITNQLLYQLSYAGTVGGRGQRAPAKFR